MLVQVMNPCVMIAAHLGAMMALHADPGTAPMLAAGCARAWGRQAKTAAESCTDAT